MIAGYLDLLAAELDFDRALARSVRQEVQDHLWETVAADPAGDTPAAQQRAIENFGDARSIAAQFAVLSLARHTRKAGLAAIALIAGVFIVMYARVAWFAATQWAVSEETRAISAMVISVDRYAFWLAVIIGLGAWAYIRSRGIPPAFHPAYRKQLRRFFVLCIAAAAALVVSVTSDAVLTALRLAGTEWSAVFLLPVCTMAIEIACVGVLCFYIRGITLRTAYTAALLKT